MITLFNSLPSAIAGKFAWYKFDHLIVGLALLIAVVGIYVLVDYLVKKIKRKK